MARFQVRPALVDEESWLCGRGDPESAFVVRTTGNPFALAPARRAARVDPMVALRYE